MASIVVSGDTSGAVTITAPAIAGTTTLTLPTTSGTLVVTGGAQTIEFADGTVSAPSITNSGDTNTGIYFPAADTIAFTEGGVESMRIDSSGNVLVGGTASGSSPIELQQDGDILSRRLFNRPASGDGNVYFNSADNAISNIYMGGATNFLHGFIKYDDNTDYMSFGTNTLERMRITSGGNVAIGLTSAGNRLVISQPVSTSFGTGGTYIGLGDTENALGQTVLIGFGYRGSSTNEYPAVMGYLATNNGGNQAGALVFGTRDVTTNTAPTERMRINSSGNVFIGKTASAGATVGIELIPSASDNYIFVTNNASSACLYLNREGSDGTLVVFRQANTEEGSISVSGTTVSYNGGHLSRWAQTTAPKDDTLLKGTVLSNLDEMNEYVDAEGNVVANEQLNKVKVSDVEGDVNVAGVFVNWSFDEQHNVDEINMAMTGDMIIRIAQGVVVQKGDLLMSAGDGTAKPQGDDIVRSKTVAKVTSNHVTCTYADGSYCVPCVLMAC